MNLQESGQFQVRAAPAAVWAFVQSPERVARCLPEVQEVRAFASHAEAAVQVRAGLLRGTFQLRIEVQPDEARGHITVRAQGGGLGSTLHLIAGATVLDAGDGTTTLNWNGTVEMGGPVASVGGSRLEQRARALIERTFQNLQASLNSAAGTLA